MSRIDVTSELDWLYKSSSKKPSFVEVPAFNYLMLDGWGDPVNSKIFKEALYIIQQLAWAIKMRLKADKITDKSFDYILPPYEGLFWLKGEKFNHQHKKDWKWTLMMMQPEFILPEIVKTEMHNLSEFKQSLLYSGIRFESLNEGLSVQMMHYGDHQLLPETLQKINTFIKEKGFAWNGKYHEVFYTHPAKKQEEKYKALIRIPVKKLRIEN